jgi:hypothetical protein
MSAVLALKTARAAGLTFHIEGEHLVIEGRSAPPPDVLEAVSGTRRRSSTSCAMTLQAGLLRNGRPCSTNAPRSLSMMAGSVAWTPSYGPSRTVSTIGWRRILLWQTGMGAACAAELPSLRRSNLSSWFPAPRPIRDGCMLGVPPDGRTSVDGMHALP